MRTFNLSTSIVTITATQFHSLAGNPVSLVEGVDGHVIEPLRISIQHESNGIGYSGGEYASVCYGSPDDDTPCQIGDLVNFSLGSTIPNRVSSSPVVTGGTNNIVGKGLNFAGPNNFADGGGDVTITVVYALTPVN